MEHLYECKHPGCTNKNKMNAKDVIKHHKDKHLEDSKPDDCFWCYLTKELHEQYIKFCLYGR